MNIIGNLGIDKSSSFYGNLTQLIKYSTKITNYLVFHYFLFTTYPNY